MSGHPTQPAPERFSGHRQNFETLPEPFRSDVAALEAAFTTAGDDEYALLVDRVVTAVAAMPADQQAAAEQLLAACAERAQAARTVNQLVRALPDAVRGETRPLPEHLEVTELVLPAGDVIAVVAPRPVPPSAPASLRRAVATAREAAFTGMCGHCGRRLTAQAGGGFAVSHTTRCVAEPLRLARSLARSLARAGLN